MIERFASGRVLLAWDAAHCYSLTGGQGPNSGIQDGFKLGWKLSLILKGLSPTSLIESYDTERITVIATILNEMPELLNTAFPLKGQVDFRNFRQKTEFDLLGVNYRGSPHCLDERTKAGYDGSRHDAYGSQNEGREEIVVLRAGDRVPDALELVFVSSNNMEE